MSILERWSHAVRGYAAPSLELPGSIERPRVFEVIVLHTSIKETLWALKSAATLADGLGAQIRLLVLETVPYPLALHHPRVNLEFTKCRFCTVAADARVDTHVDIRIGRDYRTMLDAALHPRSIVVIGGRAGWWPSFRRQLARRLERQGHQVIFSAAN